MNDSKLDKTIADLAYILDSLMSLRTIYESGDCNECASLNTCQYSPKPGELTRYNCFLFSRKK